MGEFRFGYVLDGEMHFGSLREYGEAWTHVHYSGDFVLDKAVVAYVEGKFVELEVEVEYSFTNREDWMYYVLRVIDPKTQHRFDVLEVKIDGRS